MRFAARLFVLAITATAAAAEFDVLPTVAFEEGYSSLFGGDNVVRSSDDRTVRLVLDQYSGSGFRSSRSYMHGFFSAAVRLPANYTAGVVVAFYMSNGDDYAKTHDEVDFEFLGNIDGQPWRVQSNVYGNGSTSRGREERYSLPFDPTVAGEPHCFSISWSPDSIIFFVDDTPIREVRRSDEMGGDYPSKPMWVYATIWDGSAWATAGGKYKVDYSYSPFVSEFSRLVICGGAIDDEDDGDGFDDWRCAAARAEGLSPEQRAAMMSFRRRHMTYSFCNDVLRYPVAFPDCGIVAAAEWQRFREDGHLKAPAAAGYLSTRRRRRSRRRSRSLQSPAATAADE